MPTPTLSPYEIDRLQQRDASRRQKQRDRLIRTHRSNVEETISLDRGASQLERDIQAFDVDENGFQQRAAADRLAWWCKAIFVSAVVLYVAGEFFASGDVAEWLAHQIAPLFTVTAGETPVWLRIGAGVGFITLMLGVTLLLKFVTTWFIHGLQDRRRRVEVGDHRTYWTLTTGIWLNHSAKVGYLALVAILYLWLFGFVEERAALTAAIVAEREAATAGTDLGFTLTDGEFQLTEPVGPADSAEATGITAGSQLAYATGVVYVCLWFLHGLVLLLPADGLGRELPLAHFKRGTAGRRVESMREKEGRLLRDILERIRMAEGEDRDILIRETLPVASRVNEAVGYQALEVPPRPGFEADPHGAGVHQEHFSDEAAGTAATNDPGTPPGVPDQQDVYQGIFDAPPPPEPRHY